MKNLLIIFNVIFLFAGNVLLSNIHHHEHHHEHKHETYECHECIVIENSNNYVADFQEVNLSNNNINLFVSDFFSIIEFDVTRKYLARAPPIS